MILTVTYDYIWCICWCYIRIPELLILEHMGSPPAFVGSVLLICLVFSIVNFVFFFFHYVSFVLNVACSAGLYFCMAPMIFSKVY